MFLMKLFEMGCLCIIMGLGPLFGWLWVLVLVYFQFSGTSLYWVAAQVRELENNPNFNAGRGSVLTTDGTVEMEACIMDGNTKKCGAVSGLTTVVNPISLARLVMEKTPHIYLAFDGAEAFAREQVSGIVFNASSLLFFLCHSNCIKDSLFS